MGAVASGDPTATGCADWVWGCVRSGNRWCLTDGQGRLACLSELVDRPGGVSYDWQGDSGLAVLELHDERDIRFKDEVTRACVEAARRIGDWDGDDGLRAVCFCPAGLRSRPRPCLRDLGWMAMPWIIATSVRICLDSW